MLKGERYCKFGDIVGKAAKGICYDKIYLLHEMHNLPEGKEMSEQQLEYEIRVIKKNDLSLAKSLDKITFYDVYKAVDCLNEDGLFRFHENPNIKCPVGKNIHKAMDLKLEKIQDNMENEMRNITVADVAADLKKEISSQ